MSQFLQNCQQQDLQVTGQLDICHLCGETQLMLFGAYGQVCLLCRLKTAHWSCSLEKDVYWPCLTCLKYGHRETGSPHFFPSGAEGLCTFCRVIYPRGAFIEQGHDDQVMTVYRLMVGVQESTYSQLTTNSYQLAPHRVQPDTSHYQPIPNYWESNSESQLDDQTNNPISANQENNLTSTNQATTSQSNSIKTSHYQSPPAHWFENKVYIGQTLDLDTSVNQQEKSDNNGLGGIGKPDFPPASEPIEDKSSYSEDLKIDFEPKSKYDTCPAVITTVQSELVTVTNDHVGEGYCLVQ